LTSSQREKSSARRERKVQTILAGSRGIKCRRERKSRAGGG